MKTHNLNKKDRAADLRLRKHYGLTLEEYQRILEFQKGRCAICKRPHVPGKPRLSVDHDHRSGLLRGLLCFRCNKLLLGAFNDNVELLKAAFDYLSTPPITVVFNQARLTAPGRVGTKRRAKLLSQIHTQGADV